MRDCNAKLMIENVIQICFNASVKKQQNTVYVLNPSTCACGYNTNCEIGEYLKTCTCFIYDLVTIGDKIMDAPKNVSINCNDKKETHKMDYYILHTRFLVTIVLLIIFTICYY